MGLAAVATISAPQRRPRNVSQVIQALRRQNPQAGQSELSEQLADELSDDRALLLAVSHDLVRKELTPAKVKSKPVPTLKTAEANRRQRVARQEAEKQVVKAAASKVREQVLLDLVMPNGVAMRYCLAAMQRASSRVRSFAAV